MIMLRRLLLAVGVLSAFGTAQVMAGDSKDDTDLAVKVVTLRLAQASCKKFGIELSTEGQIFNDIMKRKQEEDAEFRMTLHAAFSLVKNALNDIGYPEYCSHIIRRFPDMLTWK